MRLVFGLVLIAGIALAGFAVHMAQGLLGTYETNLEQERIARQAMVETTEILIVTRPIEYGEKITAEDVALAPFSVNHLPEGSFATTEEFFTQGEDLLRTVLRPMEANEAILAVKVSEPGDNAGLTGRLTKGYRAFAIDVDATSGVSGFLRPGDHVDVYWSGKALGNEVTKLIESGVKLIAVDQSANSGDRDVSIAKTVTVEVTPIQVAALAQAQATGDLTLSLVGTADDTIVAAGIEVDQNSLLGIVANEVSAPVAQKICTIKSRRGGEVIETPIPCRN